MVILVESFKEGNSNMINGNNSTANYNAYFYYASDTTITISSVENATLVKVVGIK